MPEAMVPGPLHAIIRSIGRTQWLRMSVRRRIVKRFFDPQTIEASTFVTDFFRLKYAGSFDSIIDWCVYYFGSFAPHELSVLDELAGGDNSKVFWDIGGNTGHHSLFMAQRCRKIHYFEPFPALRERFCRNVELNSLDHVSVHDFGLGEQEQTLTYYAPTTRNLGTGSFLESHAPDNKAAGEFLIRVGDDAARSLELDPPDIIKLDVEGFEFPVLRGLKQTLQDCQPTILVEITASSLTHLRENETLSSLIPFPHTIVEIQPPRHTAVFFQKSGFVRSPYDPNRIGKGNVSQYLLIQPSE